MRILLLLLVALATFGQPSAAADLAQTKRLTLDGARRILDAAMAYAKVSGAPGGAVAIVDEGGSVILLARLDNTFPAAGDISVGKARTAAAFGKPTRIFEDIVNKGRTTMVALPHVTAFTPLQGGVPVIVDGQVVGAIGVSGAASAAQDDEIAQAGADAFASADTHAAAPVRYLDGKSVKAAFRNGAPLVEDTRYKVHASRRDGAGEAEIHLGDTDIFYVLAGKATFVTGGELVDARTISPGELRGSGIRGGESRTLASGDLIVIPQGVPHWFKDVSSPFTYYVVKSTS